MRTLNKREEMAQGAPTSKNRKPKYKFKIPHHSKVEHDHLMAIERVMLFTSSQKLKTLTMRMFFNALKDKSFFSSLSEDDKEDLQFLWEFWELMSLEYKK